jgi:hypothetical protein
MLATNLLPSMATDNKGVNFRLPADLLKRIRQEAMEEGLAVESGRIYNPSAVVERILRAYFAKKQTPAKEPARRGSPRRSKRSS